MVLFDLIWIGLLIVFENDRFSIRFLIVFKNDRFVFGKKRSFLKTTHSFLTFRKRITIVFDTIVFYKTIVNEGSSLTIVNEGSSLTIVNEG